MGPSASKRVEVIRDLIRGLHQGQQQLLHKQAEHMAASDTSSEYRFILATEGPSTHGSFDNQTSTSVGWKGRPPHHLSLAAVRYGTVRRPVARMG